MRFRLKRVRTMPAQLEFGVLYVSDEFETAAHLCACGCGSKIRTPLGPTEWTFIDSPDGPSLRPSIGNWQRPCQSHYWLENGAIEWSTQWSAQRIAAGREEEQSRRDRYYSERFPDRWWTVLWRRIKSIFS